MYVPEIIVDDVVCWPLYNMLRNKNSTDLLKAPEHSEREARSGHFSSILLTTFQLLTVKGSKYFMPSVWPTTYTQYGQFQPDFDASRVLVHILEDAKSDSDPS